MTDLKKAWAKKVIADNFRADKERTENVVAQMPVLTTSGLQMSGPTVSGLSVPVVKNLSSQFTIKKFK